MTTHASKETVAARNTYIDPQTNDKFTQNGETLTLVEENE